MTSSPAAAALGLAGRCALVGALVTVSACYPGGPLDVGDPPPEPEQAPLEVVATTSLRPERCLLNRHDLAAGTHEVTLVSELGPASVRIRDGAGTVVFEEDVLPQVHDGDPPDALPEPEVPFSAVTLTAGEYVVECASGDGDVSAATLQVAPARPGFEDRGPLR